MEEKDLEFLVEENHLSHTIIKIKEEIRKTIEKRKVISNKILENRKIAIKEYEDDEDRVIEYFDHESFTSEKAYEVLDKNLREMVSLTSSPYFGRVDFREDDLEAESIYIGRYGVMAEDTFEPIIVDWRAPIASMFYEGKLGDVTFSVPNGKIDAKVLLKRQFIIKKEKLKGMFDSAIDIKDEVLQKVLSENSSSEKLKDIIMTLQKEQDYIIRRPKDKTIIVDGVAGSGKTTIALHRVAYLLYNFRKNLQGKMLILGPNNIFMEYIMEVLPSLGEDGVNQKTFREFAMDFLDISFKELMTFEDYMERVVSGDKNFINTLKKKSLKEFINDLDGVLETMEKNQEYKSVKYYDKTVFQEEEVKEMFISDFKSMPLFRRRKKIKRVIVTRLKNFRDDKIREIEKEFKDKLNFLSKESKNLELTNLEYERTLKRREAIKEVLKVKKQLSYLNYDDVYKIYREFLERENIPLDDSGYTSDDLAALLYLKVKLEGVKAYDEIKHVVIDEAQDYSRLQFKVIRELTSCSAMTVVGDTNQRLLPQNDINYTESLKEEFNNMEVENHNLLKSYRSTKEIMEYASRYLKEDKVIPLVRNGEKAREFEPLNEEELVMLIEEIMEDYAEKELESVAIITKTMKKAKDIGRLLKEFKYIKLYDNEGMLYKGGNIIIPSYFAKGLEFDGVIMIDEDTKDTLNNRLNYVISTRAMHNLAVLKIK